MKGLYYLYLCSLITAYTCFTNSNNEFKTQISLKKNNNDEMITLLKEYVKVLEEQKDFYSSLNESIIHSNYSH